MSSLRSLVLAFALISTQVAAECVHEYSLSGKELLSENHRDLLVEVNQRYLPLYQVKSLLQKDKVYTVHKQSSFKGDDDEYNRKYVKYYRPKRMGEYLSTLTPSISQADYQRKLLENHSKVKIFTLFFPM